MSTAVALQEERQKPSQLQAFMGKVLPPADKQAVKSVLPAHVPFERFERNLSNAIMNQPKLMTLNPREVFREVAKVAALGLLFDAQLGEAYLIASATGPQARIGYRGLIKLARQSGEIASIYAHEVYENDEIECVLGDEKRLKHKPDLFGDRGEIVGYYAVVKFKDGETDFEPMTTAQIDKIRDKSDGFRAFKAGKIKSTPWSTDYDEMAKKTCIRRLMKRLPQSPDLSTALQIEDRAEHHLELQAEQPTGLVHRLRSAQAPAPQIEGFSQEHVDAETGEVLDQAPVDTGPSTAFAETETDTADLSTDQDGAEHNDDDLPAEETLLDRAREKALEGSKAFKSWKGKLTQKEFDEIQEALPALEAAAKQADGVAA